MSPAVNQFIDDKDLSATVLLWLRDMTRHGLILKEPRSSGIDFEMREDGLHLKIPRGYFFIEPNKNMEFARKAAVKAGWAHDYRSIEHVQVLRRIHELRAKAAACLKEPENASPYTFLLRVDDFPAPNAASEDFLEFHDAAREAGVPYLLGVTPFLGRAENSGGLTPREIEILKKCSDEGMEVALHGFTHQPLHSRYKSELLGMSEVAVRSSLAQAQDYFYKIGFEPRVFIAPFNSYDCVTYPALASQFPVICGGPESSDTLGRRVGPCYLNGSLYIPSYRGAYDVISSSILQGTGLPDFLPVPLTVHWANGKKDGWKSMRQLFKQIRTRVIPWKKIKK